MSSTSKVVLVTGGNRGIGRAVCEMLLAQYPEVHVVMGSRSMGRGTEAAKDIVKAVGGTSNDRLEVVEMDTSSDDSVTKAAKEISQRHPSLYGIVNNAGIGFEHTGPNIMNTNYFGVRRVDNALLSLVQNPGGRIVNVGSASGPMFLTKLSPTDPLRIQLNHAWTIAGGIAELDQMATKMDVPKEGGGAYGISKAYLHAYTALQAKANPKLIINAVTPGFIASDLGKALGATKPCSEGAKPIVYCLMDKELESFPTGRYYGSDAKRSPLDVYRGPGDPVYEGPDWE